MVILGIADGHQASAAVVKDDRLVSVVAEERVTDAPEPFPWTAATRALELAEVAPSDVRTVAVCGRYTPPLQVRRHPELWKLARDPFSPALVAGTALQRLLRDTGIGAASADRATDWAREVLAEKGYRPGRVQLVDVHKCAANAAYRSQKVDRVRVLVAQPRGDGALASVHDAVAGQLDRVFVDRGSQNAHAAVDRGLAVLGLSGLDELRALARGHVPDDGLVTELGAVLSFGVAFRSRRRPERRALPPWSVLAEVDRPVAAASLLERLRRCLLCFVEQHLPAKGRPIVLAGAWLDDPALAVRAADELGAAVQLASWVGTRALAVGAAAASAGLPPRTVSPDLGSAAPEWTDGERVTLAAEAAVLAGGG
ncbi:MAG: hypothetical protein KC621_35405, partial [Myxococcales bacterium]|nr:hypothetical protein [Myxococcales bacterium]